ncbi:hypothetical protein OAB57_02815 [Bacteriovoracaceae bacterium]|nr:hypothetical protein [Bacteriovoracaceae bacterium]
MLKRLLYCVFLLVPEFVSAENVIGIFSWQQSSTSSKILFPLISGELPKVTVQKKFNNIKVDKALFDVLNLGGLTQDASPLFLINTHFDISKPETIEILSHKLRKLGANRYVLPSGFEKFLSASQQKSFIKLIVTHFDALLSFGDRTDFTYSLISSFIKKERGVYFGMGEGQFLGALALKAHGVIQNQMSSAVKNLDPDSLSETDLSEIIPKFERSTQALSNIDFKIASLALQQKELSHLQENHQLEQKELESAKQQFIESYKYAQSVRKIRFETQKQLEVADSQIEDSFQQKIMNHLQIILNDNQGKISSEKLSPLSIERPNHPDLPTKYLSNGTYASLALAIHLSIATTFWGDQSGFIVLDDPFVDMDLSRTTQAANILNQLATKHQIILLTCHDHIEDIFNNLKNRV